MSSWFLHKMKQVIFPTTNPYPGQHLDPAKLMDGLLYLFYFSSLPYLSVLGNVTALLKWIKSHTNCTLFVQSLLPFTYQMETFALLTSQLY